MKVGELAESHIRQHGYDGLVNTDASCGCDINDLGPCGEMSAECEFGYKRYCHSCSTKDISDCDFFADCNGWCISSGKDTGA